MHSHLLDAMLQPFNMIASRNAMAATYKVIELSPDRLKAASHYALLESYGNIGIDQTTYVDAMAFLSLMDSMPSGHEVALSVKDNVLHWQCGPAKGRLATLPAPDMPEFPEPSGDAFAPASKALGEALDRAGISCDNPALSAIGVYGIVLYNGEDSVIACSTDNFTVSAYQHPHPLPDMPAKITLPPLGAALLSTIMGDDGALQFNRNMQYGEVLYTSDRLRCMVRGVPDLNTDLMEVVGPYWDCELTSQLPKDRIAAFIKRINALSDNRRYAKVVMGAADGRITLAFSEGTASSEEYILADSLGGFPNIAPISLPAAKIARALNHVNEIALDYIERGVIVLRGGDFRYIISGTVVA